MQRGKIQPNVEGAIYKYICNHNDRLAFIIRTCTWLPFHLNYAHFTGAYYVNACYPSQTWGRSRFTKLPTSQWIGKFYRKLSVYTFEDGHFEAHASALFIKATMLSCYPSHQRYLSFHVIHAKCYPSHHAVHYVIKSWITCYVIQANITISHCMLSKLNAPAKEYSCICMRLAGVC